MLIASLYSSNTHQWNTQFCQYCIVIRTLAGMILTSRSHNSTSYFIRLSLLYSVEAVCLTSHPACFTLGKEPQYPVNKRQNGAQNWYGAFGEEKVLSSSYIRIPDHLGHSQATILTLLPWFHLFLQYVSKLCYMVKNVHAVIMQSLKKIYFWVSEYFI